jgi:hypothetical protein
MQGEEKKVRFTSIPKANAKVVPLNMFVKKVDRIGTEAGVKKYELIGMKADGIGMKKYDPTAMTASNGKVTQPFGGTVSQHCGGHHCPGYDATCRSLSAGVFKAPGGCSFVEKPDMRCLREDNDFYKPLRNDAMSPENVGKTLHVLFKEPGMKELNPAIARMEDGGWQKIKGVMDSGASESVAHPSMCPQYAVKPSVGSTTGLKYVSASGDVIANLGEQLLEVETEDGMQTKIRYQSAEVSRPLNSVSEICDAGGNDGQYVVFSRYGGVILNLETGRRTSFDRVDGIYELGLWVKPPSNEASVFPRPGM